MNTDQLSSLQPLACNWKRCISPVLDGGCLPSVFYWLTQVRQQHPFLETNALVIIRSRLCHLQSGLLASETLRAAVEDSLKIQQRGCEVGCVKEKTHTCAKISPYVWYWGPVVPQGGCAPFRPLFLQWEETQRLLHGCWAFPFLNKWSACQSLCTQHNFISPYNSPLPCLRQLPAFMHTPQPSRPISPYVSLVASSISGEGMASLRWGCPGSLQLAQQGNTYLPEH